MSWKPLVLVLGLSTSFPGISRAQPHHSLADKEALDTDSQFYNPDLKKEESAVNTYIQFYQKYVSGIRPTGCPMYPSCSRFGLKTFNEVGFASAFVQTSDRLLRCGHDYDNYALSLQNDGFKLLDYPYYDTPPEALYYRGNTYSFAYSDTIADPPHAAFIKHLINNHYYREALLEIMRYEYEADNFDIDLFINKIICLKALEEYENALYDYAVRCPPEYKAYPELAYQIALIHYRLGNLTEALASLSLVAPTGLDNSSLPKHLMMQGLLYAHQLDWHQAGEVYQYASAYDSYKQASQANLQLTQEARSLKEKSPALAGILSVIPGAGYAYAGHRQTGLSALIINGLLGFATYSSIKNKNYGIGILTGVFTVSFYAGNIFGAIKSAKRYNEQQKETILKKIESNTNL